MVKPQVNKVTLTIVHVPQIFNTMKKSFLIVCFFLQYLNVFAQNDISLIPIPGKKYLISCWASEQNTDVVTFENAKVIIKCRTASATLATYVFDATGKIIDGWQKIEGEFLIPIGSYVMDIELNAVQGQMIHYDDMRLQPADASMKTYVYDPDTQRLMAELDENNYATYYEYDNEGGLVRIKKETERGVFTIKETRSSTKKDE